MNRGGKAEGGLPRRSRRAKPGKRKAKTRESSRLRLRATAGQASSSCSSFVLDFGAVFGTIGSRSQCASEIRRSGLSMNLTFGNSQLLAFSPHPGPLPVEGRGSSSWSQCASKSWRSVLPMNLTLTRPCGHPLPSDPGYAGGFAEASGRGAWSLPRACRGGQGSFASRFMAPNAHAKADGGPLHDLLALA